MRITNIKFGIYECFNLDAVQRLKNKNKEKWVKLAWKWLEISQTDYIVRLHNWSGRFWGKIEMDSLSRCIFRDAFSGYLISHGISEESQRWTHSLDVFLGCLVSYGISEKSQRWTHILDAFSGCLISYAISENLQRWTHKLDAFSGCLISHMTYAISEESQRWTHLLDAFQVVCSVLLIQKNHRVGLTS